MSGQLAHRPAGMHRPKGDSMVPSSYPAVTHAGAPPPSEPPAGVCPRTPPRPCTGMKGTLPVPQPPLGLSAGTSTTAPHV